MSLLLEDALSRDGVAVTRAAYPEAAGAACAECLAASLDGLERKLALPQTMAERMRGASLRLRASYVRGRRAADDAQ